MKAVQMTAIGDPEVLVVADMDEPVIGSPPSSRCS